VRVVGVEEIRAAVPPAVVFDAVRAALVAHAAGNTVVPSPMHLPFPHGDTHVKAGYVADQPHFVVKTASSFRGRNTGSMLLLSATTGAPVAMLADDGLLTAWRTAAAGALITDALTPVDVDEVAVMGTGEQARLQMTWLAQLRKIRLVHVWGRRPEAAALLCEQLRASGLDARPGYESGAACVVTTTAAPDPLPLTALRAALHITGIGTDMPGKGELPPSLFAGALVVTDDHEQCLDHGDFGHAVRAGFVDAQADLPVGTVLDGARRSTRSIADLTGIGATDAAVSGAVWGLLG
jgi:ornithine cyclodeaminase/alanine dehydrogenase-like protein (mu-crystallin family)